MDPSATNPEPPGPQLRLHSDGEPAAFVPLRLVLQPSGVRVEVNRPDVVVGRHTEADVRLALPDVSRRHCRLLFALGGWQVIDLNSLNGVHVNGEQVLQAPLEHDDQLRIGGLQFVVELVPTAALESAGHVQSILEALTGPHRRAS